MLATKQFWKRHLLTTASSCWRVWVWNGKRARKMEKITFAHFISPPCLLCVILFLESSLLVLSLLFHVVLVVLWYYFSQDWKSAHGKTKLKKNQNLVYNVKGNVAENEVGLLYSDRPFLFVWKTKYSASNNLLCIYYIFVIIIVFESGYAASKVLYAD